MKDFENTNEMIIRYERGDNIAEPGGEWNMPFGIVLDSTKPGKFALSGAMTLPNLQYLLQLLKLEMMKRTKEIVLDMTKVTKMDPSCKAALDETDRKMKNMGIHVKIRAPEKNLQALFSK